MFSAVDSAFLILAMGGLSASSSDETNNLLRLLVLHANGTVLIQTNVNPPFSPGPGVVRQNCFFMASLFSSLIAAAGAVLAKQWLADYERTGQTGPLDEQGLRRTRKFLGAERWGLRYVVEALPTLIIISLGLFFVAMADYVWTINEELAILITAFSSIATVLYVTMLLSAAMSPDCPFQTAPSFALLNLWHIILRPICLLLRNTAFLVTGAMFILCGIVGALLLQVMCFDPRDVPGSTPVGAAADVMRRQWTSLPRLRDSYRPHVRTQTGDSGLLCCETARSMLAISPHDGVVLAVAQNIPALSDLSGLQRLGQSEAVLTLASKLGSSLSSFQRTQAEPELQNVLLLARALVHILNAGPTALGGQILSCLPWISDDRVHIASWLSSPELRLFYLCAFLHCAPMRDELVVTSWAHEDFPLSAFMSLLSRERGIICSCDAIGYLHCLTVARVWEWGPDSWDYSLGTIEAILSNEAIPTTTPLIGLASQALSNAMEAILSEPILPLSQEERAKRALSIRFG